MAKRSEFKRLRKLNMGLPKSGVRFLEESGYKGYGGILDGWYRGDIAHTKEYVLVMVNGEGEGYVVLSRKEGEIVAEHTHNLYQTFLAHKEARFA